MPKKFFLVYFFSVFYLMSIFNVKSYTPEREQLNLGEFKNKVASLLKVSVEDNEEWIYVIKNHQFEIWTPKSNFYDWHLIENTGDRERIVAIRQGAFLDLSLSLFDLHNKICDKRLKFQRKFEIFK
jgi:hypothetical protein